MITLVNTTEDKYVEFVDVLVNIIVIFYGINVHVPILVPVHTAFVISITLGTSIVIVPLGVLSGKL